MGILADIGRVLIKLDESRSSQIPEKDVATIKALLKFIAEGGIYGGALAVIGIGLASYYAGWLGMTVIMLLFGITLLALGSIQLKSILKRAGEKTRTAWERYLLATGFLLIALALMGLLDSIPFTPSPIPDPNWVAKGAVGLGLTIAGLIWVKARHR